MRDTKLTGEADLPYTQSTTGTSTGVAVHDQRDDLISRASIILGVYYLCVTVYSIYSQLYYFADGAYFFLRMLRAEDFVRLNPNRIYAHYATQFLPVAAMKIFGIKNYVVLSYLYGINLHLPFIAGLAICYALTKHHNPYLMIFPLLSLFGVSMNSMIFIVAQAHVISSVFWAIVFYMTLKEKYSLKDFIVFFLLILIFIKSYESALFLGPILAFISLPRIFRTKGLQRLVWTAASILFLASVVIALREIVHPYDSGNRMNFAMSILELYRHYPALLSLAFIVFISLLLVMPELPNTYFVSLTMFLSAAALLVAFTPLLNPHLIRPHLQYNARVLMAYVTPIMGVLFYLVVSGRVSISGEKWRRVAALTAILAFSQLSWQTIVISQWDGFRKVFREELAQHRGLVFFQDSILSRDRIGDQLIRPFAWGWTVTTLSILWCDQGNVSTIITNMPAYATWGPFDPLRIESLPRLEKFGFSYNEYEKAPHEIDRSYTLNENLIFSKVGNFSRYILRGWSNAEDTHVWTSGKVASMVFKTGDPHHNPTIEAEVIPFIVPPRLLKQRFTVMVNGEKAGQSEISGPEKIQFTVPRNIWMKSDPVVIEFLLPDATSAKSVGFNDDKKAIALAFRSLRIY